MILLAHIVVIYLHGYVVHLNNSHISLSSMDFNIVDIIIFNNYYRVVATLE